MAQVRAILPSKNMTKGGSVVDLSVELAGIKLKNPLIVGAGPRTKNFTTALNCIKAGFGAIVVRSLHLQHLNQPKKSQREFWRIYSTRKNFAKSLYSFQSLGMPTQRIRAKVAPGWGGAAPCPTLEQWAEEVRKMTRAAKEYDCAVIASIGWGGSRLADDEVWIAEAKAMAEAGVDGIELQTAPSPSAEPGRYMIIDPHRYLEVPIKLAKQAVNLPVFAKLTADCCDQVAMAGIAQKAGADSVVPTTRWASLPIDIEREREPVWRGPGIGGPWSAPIMNGFIFRMRHADQPFNSMFKGSTVRFPNAIPITIPIIPSGGVRSGANVIGYIIAGANAAQMCTQVIVEGTGVAERILREIRSWMERKGYQKISEFQGILRLMEPEEPADIPDWTPSVDESLCNACMRCINACTNQAINLVNNIAHIDESYCEGCHICHYVCPTGAISLNGWDMGINWLSTIKTAVNKKAKTN
jgi:dihydropyrimidine dehydrogenase (NAD+) subunit PreA